RDATAEGGCRGRARLSADGCRRSPDHGADDDRAGAPGRALQQVEGGEGAGPDSKAAVHPHAEVRLRIEPRSLLSTASWRSTASEARPPPNLPTRPNAAKRRPSAAAFQPAHR